MVFRRFTAHLLAMLVVAGLVVAPLVTPAAAMTSAHAEVTDMASMSGAMPCCPDENSGCQDCPLAAMCVSTISQAVPNFADGIPMRLSRKTTHVVFDDVLSRGLDRPPPDHPPRNLV